VGLIDEEIKELRKLGSMIINGEIDNDKARCLLGVYNQTAKRENMLIQVVLHSGKAGKKNNDIRMLNSMNVIDQECAIECGIEASVQKVKCPEQGGRLVSREDCLDYSGTARNIDSCQKCEQFDITRKYCLNITEK